MSSSIQSFVSCVSSAMISQSRQDIKGIIIGVSFLFLSSSSFSSFSSFPGQIEQSPLVQLYGLVIKLDVTVNVGSST